jgi:hypothetical protein
VPDDPRPPVAIRITRPYATEDEFLDKELDTLTRTTVVLIGAQSRPQGVVLRFELALSSGQVLVRGEGRVVGFKPNAYDGQAGLTLRFTRLDTRSKAMVDRASSLREERKPSTRPPPPPEAARAGSNPPPAPVNPPPLPPPARLTTATPTATPTATATSTSTPTPTEHTPASEREHAHALTPEHATAPATPPAPGRESLLDRLRTRAAALDASAVARILARRRSDAR